MLNKNKVKQNNHIGVAKESRMKSVQKDAKLFELLLIPSVLNERND